MKNTSVLIVAIAALVLFGCLGSNQEPLRNTTIVQNVSENVTQNTTTNQNGTVQNLTEFDCTPGIHNINGSGVSIQDTVIGWTAHNGQQMCHVTFEGNMTVTVTGMNETIAQIVGMAGDCYSTQLQDCCANTIGGESVLESCVNQSSFESPRYVFIQ